MGMFNAREPRRFRRVSIYTDERKEKLQKLVDDVRREKGEIPETEQPYDPAKFKGKFINYTPHLQRHKERSHRFGWPFLILLLFAMIIIWRFLLR